MTPQLIANSRIPTSLSDRLSVSEFFTKYNPDEVRDDKVVLVDATYPKSITYGGLRQQSAACAYGFRHRYRLKEQGICLAILPNCADFVLLAHSTWWAGAIFAPLNSASLPKDIAEIIDVIKPAHISTTPTLLGKVREGLRSSQFGNSSACVIFTVTGRAPELPLFPDDFMLPGGDMLPPYSLEGNSAKEVVAMIGFSSGTTGKMKGVTLSHYNLNASVYQSRLSVHERMNSSNIEIWFPPYCHIYGVYMVVLINMWVGGFICGLERFDLDTYCKKIEQYKANEMHLVPPIAIALVNHPNLGQYDLSSIRAINIAAAPLKRSLQSALRGKFPGVPITQLYGSTEATGATTAQRYDTEESNGSVGKLLAGIDGRVVGPKTKQDVTSGEEGELWVRGANIMMGYYNNEAANNEAFEGEWQRTGDLVKVDQEGNIWVVDRLKEMIKYKGFQVPPSELEALLMTHPFVIDAAVTSIYSDLQATELPIAYVALTPEKEMASVEDIHLSLDDIRVWTDGRLADYKKLRGGVYHLQALPRNPSGKLLRKDLPCNKKNARSAFL